MLLLLQYSATHWKQQQNEKYKKFIYKKQIKKKTNKQTNKQTHHPKELSIQTGTQLVTKNVSTQLPKTQFFKHSYFIIFQTKKKQHNRIHKKR